MTELPWREERVRGWGMTAGGIARVLRPCSRDEVIAAVAEVAARGQTLGLRGSGCSYGDAALNTGGHLLDLGRFDRILSFDATTGIVDVEPGVTIRRLWRHGIEQGFWPAVVPGTMAVSCGGAAAMNVHGKNNFAVGTFGDHLLDFDLLTASGEVLRCDREQNADVFHAAVGGFGMLGVFLRLRLRLKRVYSGRLRVTAFSTPDLAASLRCLEEHRGTADYLVGWLDLHAHGARLGRGAIHRADQLAPGEDPAGAAMLRANTQDLPARLFGVVPKAWIWPGMWVLLQSGAWRFVNAAKFHSGIHEARRPPYLQSHGAFHFLLDYVPNWKQMTRPGGLIQFQPFVPAAAAEQVYRELIETCHRAGLVPYLGVLKRHRPDPFLMTHAVDGYSLAMDFAVTGRRRDRLWHLCREMADRVLAAGGRFYYAKDAVLEAHSFGRIHGEEAVARFRELKQRLDPAAIFATDLSRRMLPAP